MLIASLILIVGVVLYVGFKVSASGGSRSVKDYEGTGNGVTEIVQIPEGSGISQLGPELVDRDIVASDPAFQTAAANNPDANSVRPGFYRLQQKMSANAAVKAFIDPDNHIELLDVQGGGTLMDVKVVGGTARPGIYSQISAAACDAAGKGKPCVQPEELEHVAATVDPRVLGAPEWARDAVLARGADPRRIEGLIAPGRYVVDPEMSAQEILTDLISRTTKRYNETGIVDRAKAIGLTPYELLTAASLVEREAPAGEFNKVARVILNRLKEPMRLEFDSTVNYGLDEVEVATRDSDRAQVTPWNTYAMDGLPKTPIAAPGDEAILAMENPAEGNWLFFVTISTDGTTVFNDTFEQHLNDVQRAIDSGVLNSKR